MVTSMKEIMFVVFEKQHHPDSSKYPIIFIILAHKKCHTKRMKFMWLICFKMPLCLSAEMSSCSPAKLSSKKKKKDQRNTDSCCYFCTHRTHLIALWLQTRNKKTHDIFNAQFIFLFIACQMKLAQLSEGPRRKIANSCSVWRRRNNNLTQQ